MTSSINVNLSGRQVIDICNALNTEGQRFVRLLETRHNDVPAQTRRVWEKAAERHFAMSKQLIKAKEDDQRNPHIPIVLAA